jgi:hypothetical protein
MRIELQLVEFERGSYQTVPVAANPSGEVLINQLMGNQFAQSITPVNPVARHLVGLTSRPLSGDQLGHNGTSQGILRREIVVEDDQMTTLPVTFDPPVQFEIPVS